MEEVRKFRFSLDEARTDRGVVKLIGRASDVNPTRFAREDNLLFDEKSLSKNHALLGLKLLDPLETGLHIIDQFRIYVKDLGSTYGIVDLNSEESDPFVIDLKNGERFGLIGLEQPISIYQCRAAKLKFQVNLQYHDAEKGIFECIVKDVSFDDSPVISRPSTCGDYSEGFRRPDEIDSASCSSSSSSSSESNFSEEFTIIRGEASQDLEVDETESDISLSSNSCSSASTANSGYTIVDLLRSSKEADDWDILESDGSDDDGDLLCTCPSRTCASGSKYVIINYAAKPVEDNTEKKNSTSVAKIFIASALIGFFLGFLGTVILLVGLALKEME